MPWTAFSSLDRDVLFNAPFNLWQRFSVILFVSRSQCRPIRRRSLCAACDDLVLAHKRGEDFDAASQVHQRILQALRGSVQMLNFVIGLIFVAELQESDRIYSERLMVDVVRIPV